MKWAKRFRWPENAAVARLDQAMAEAVPGMSRRHARVLIGQGSVYVAGRRVRRLSYPVPPGVEVSVSMLVTAAAPADVPIEVLFDGPDRLVVNKPWGLPTDATHTQATTTATAALRATHGPLWAVHRLDQETTGVLLFARSKEAARTLSEPFQRGTVGRGYLALVHGVPASSPLVVKLALGARGASGRVTVGVGKPSQTDAWVVWEGTGQALLCVVPRTGRSHQIRAHLAAVGHPLLGDTRYGAPDPPQPGFGLHAAALVLPGAEPFAIEATPPPAFWAMSAAPVPAEIQERAQTMAGEAAAQSAGQESMA